MDGLAGTRSASAPGSVDPHDCREHFGQRHDDRAADDTVDELASLQLGALRLEH